MSERDLDSLIEAVLKTDTVVTARHKHQAWDRLQQRAAHQTIWPPLTEPETSLSGTVRFAWARVRRWLTILLIDADSYERARKERLAVYVCASVNSSEMTVELSPHIRPQS